MRTVGALSTHLAGTAHTRCAMLLLGLRAGDFIGITDHNEALDYNLTEAGAGEVTYSAGSGIAPSDVVLSSSLDADNYEVTGPLGGLITREDLLGGRFDRARAWLFQVNWNELSAKIPIMVGNVSEARVEGGRFVLQVRSDADRLNQSVGRLITPYCDADFGDARCGATPEEVGGTITAIWSHLRIDVSFSGSYANDFFNQGTVEFTSGALAGHLPIEIFDWTSAGAITLFTRMAGLPAAGDTLTIKQGCEKTRTACMAFDNIINFRGFPEVPGTDQVLRFPIPGEGGT